MFLDATGPQLFYGTLTILSVMLVTVVFTLKWLLKIVVRIFLTVIRRYKKSRK